VFKPFFHCKTLALKKNLLHEKGKENVFFWLLSHTCSERRFCFHRGALPKHAIVPRGHPSQSSLKHTTSAQEGIPLNMFGQTAANFLPSAYLVVHAQVETSIFKHHLVDGYRICKVHSMR
jgi:hypothetical protein